MTIAGNVLGGRVDNHLAAVTVNEDQVTVLQVRQRSMRVHHHGQAQRTCKDRAVRQGTAGSQDEAEYAVFGKRYQLSGCNGVADQNLAHARGQLAFLDAGFATQRTLHATDDMFDVLASAAQIGVIHGLEYRNQAVTLQFERRTGMVTPRFDQLVPAGSGCVHR